MVSKIFIVALVALCVAYVTVADMNIKCDKQFLDEEICGDKGDKTIAALDEKCKGEMEKLTSKREKFCEDYKEKGVDEACTDIGNALKTMKPEEKADVKRCFGTAYKVAHGKEFGE